jgi:uncharacterized protein YqjF (DUF2071 family)
MRQSWHRLLFAHWPLPVEAVRPLLPATLPLDVAEGRAWVGVVPFMVRNSRLRALPPVPGATTFLELNVRTYVTVAGRPGVYFFSLDAASVLAVLGARTWFRLPYQHAGMAWSEADSWIRYHSRRSGGEASFEGRYRAVGDVYHAAAGTLDHFLTERYCLYTAGRAGRVSCADIQHAPWPLQRAEAEFARNTMGEVNGLQLPAVPPLLHYAAVQHVLIWPPKVLR